MGKNPEIVSIVINPFALRVRARKGQLLHEVIRGAGIEFTSICNGLGRCGKCRALITDGQALTNKSTAAEQEHLSTRELSIGFRLACQVMVQGNLEVYIPEESRLTNVRLQTDALQSKIVVLPLLRKLYVELPEPTLQSPEPDLERLLKSLHEFNSTHPALISPTILRNLPDTLRSSDWQVTATVWANREILDVEKGDTCNVCYGLAIDVGTTKIASYLVDFSTGDTIAMCGMVNPQVSRGEDILSRITYAMRGQTEREELQRAVVKGINRLIAECLSKRTLCPRHIYEATMVGNTAMHHLLLGIHPTHLALSPYVPAVKESLDIKAKELGLDINPEANVHFLPVIAGFVGSDCLADILATGLFKAKNHCLLVDIGANTEVVIGNRDRMLSCSCAAGPAFEGGDIKHGMKASSGAIEYVKIDKETLEVSFRTVDNSTPKGLCGSAIIDIVAEMLNAGIIDQMGTIQLEEYLPRVRINEEGEAEFVVVQEGKASKDIVVTQKDVGAVQLARAVIYAGICVLMEEMKIRPEQIKRVYIAGAFGTHMNPASAKVIGMIPAVPLNIVTRVGNAASSGARMALVSSKARKMCEKISKKVEYIELETHPRFHPIFMESLRFP